MLFEKPFLLLLVALLGSAVISSEASDHRGLVREIRKRDAASTNPSDLDGKTFDYVIVGGGLAGLTVASLCRKTKTSPLPSSKLVRLEPLKT